MKRGAVLKALRRQGCVFVGHGKRHDRYLQPATGVIEQVPRHPDVYERLAKKIIEKLAP